MLAQNKQDHFNVKLMHLLSLYALIPITLVLIWLDQTMFKQSILHSLPFKPENWVIWFYVFGMPHVFGSLHTLADKEYIKFYGWHLLLTVVFFIALPYVVGHFLGSFAMFVIFTAFIVYHSVAQQFGITLAAMKQKPARWFFIWKWSAVSIGVTLYAMIYGEPIPIALDLFSQYRSPFIFFASAMLIAHLVSASALLWNATNRVGAAHIIANTALIAFDIALFTQGYFVFIVIVGRIIHEFTAWHIYGIHDKNRDVVGKPNLMIKLFKFTGIPTYGLSIIMAFAVGLTVAYAFSLSPLVAPLIVSLSLIHYYSESFLWKRGSIHRQHLNFN